jgi:hypothetical protein
MNKAEKEKLLNSPEALGSEMAALLDVVSTMNMLPPHLNEKAAALVKRWRARYEEVLHRAR